MKLGILGGGQLARMMLPHAHRFGIHTTILDSADAVASTLAHKHLIGNFKLSEDVIRLQDCDVVTVEIENVSIEGLKKLRQHGVKIYPAPEVLEIIQDKFKQKSFLQENKIPTSPFLKKTLLETDRFEAKEIVKLCRGGYDGKGVWNPANCANPPENFVGQEVLVEHKVEIAHELAQLIVRSPDGTIKTGPLVKMVFDSELNLIDSAFLPANVPPKIQRKMETLAATIVERLNYVGVLAVECFLTPANEILVNELAPRPHNSGHGTIEACRCDQFEQHLRAVCSLPLGEWGMHSQALTFNLIGQASGDKKAGATKVNGIEHVLSEPNASLHLYEKTECREGRKMGHITLTSKLDNQEFPLTLLMQQKARIQKWISITPK
jgi:5-(carboxyamino)imidazole ribonucleotide synthase